MTASLKQFCKIAISADCAGNENACYISKVVKSDQVAEELAMDVFLKVECLFQVAGKIFKAPVGNQYDLHKRSRL